MPHDIVIAFGLGIARGNYTYGKFSNSGSLVDVNLSIPEAMKAAEEHITKLQEWVNKNKIILLLISQKSY